MKFDLPIVDFSRRSSLNLAQIKDDSDLGGLSEAQIGYCELSKALHIQGYINVERAAKMAEPPFFEIQFLFTFPLHCRHANAFRVELSSMNSNILAVMASSLSMSSSMESKNIGYLSVAQQDLATLSQDNFQEYDIPFENMVMEEPNLRKNRFFEHDLVPMTPRSISIYCESQIETTFDFKIKQISAVQDPDILRINSVQQKAPFFIKRLHDYSRIEIDNMSDNYGLKFKSE